MPRQRKEKPIKEITLRDKMESLDIHAKVINPANGQMVIPIETMIALRETGMQYKNIAELVGCTEQNVKTRMAPVSAKLKALPSFRKIKSNILAMKEMDLLGQMEGDKLERAPLRDLAIAYNIIHAAGRLEEGKSTQNIATYAKILKDEEQGRGVVAQKEAELLRLMAENPEYADE